MASKRIDLPAPVRLHPDELQDFHASFPFIAGHQAECRLYFRQGAALGQPVGRHDTVIACFQKKGRLRKTLGNRIVWIGAGKVNMGNHAQGAVKGQAALHQDMKGIDDGRVEKTELLLLFGCFPHSDQVTKGRKDKGSQKDQKPRNPAG